MTNNLLIHALKMQLLVLKLEKTLKISKRPLYQLGHLLHTEQIFILQNIEDSFTLPAIQMENPFHIVQLTFVIESQLIEFTLMSHHFSILRL